jgi:autotransporter-associated beta strand protein
MTKNRILFYAILPALIAFSLFSAAPAQAAALNIYGGSGNYNWNTTDQVWIGPTGPTGWIADSDAEFSGGNATMTLTQSISTSSLTFWGAAYTINSDVPEHTLTLSGTTPTISPFGPDVTISSVIAGSAGFTKLGPAALFLTGSSSNTYSGTTTLGDVGKIVLAKTNGAIAITGNINLSSMAWYGNNSGVVLAGDEQIADSSVITWTTASKTSLRRDDGVNVVGTDGAQADSFFRLNGHTETIGGLVSQGDGSLAVIENRGYEDTATYGTANLIINTTGNNRYSYNGIIRDMDGGEGGGKISITKTGTGTQILSGSNNYTGATTINGGTLVLNGTQSTSGITVNNGATLTAGTSGLNVNALTLGATTTNTTTVNVTPASILVANANGLAVQGTATINVYGAGLTLGHNTLIDYNGAIGGAGYSGFALGTLPLRVTATLFNNVTNSSVDLNVTMIDLPRWKGNLSNVWDINTTANWVLNSDGTTPTKYLQPTEFGDMVLFDDTAVGTTVNVSTSVTPTAVTVNNSTKNYTFQGTGSIDGSTGLVKQGTGALTITNSNNYTGETKLVAGTLNIGNAAALGHGPLNISGGTIDNTSGAAITLTNGVSFWNGNFTFAGTNDLDLGTATVVLNAPTQVTVNAGTLTARNGVSGAPTAGLTKAGNGTLTLVGSSGGYYGPTTVNAGRLVLKDVAGVGGQAFKSPTITIASGAILEANCTTDPEDWAVKNTYSGSGTFLKTGSKNMYFGSGSGTNVNFGSGALIDVQAGSLTLAWGAGIVWTNNLASLNVASGTTFDIWDGSQSHPINIRVNSLTGSGTIQGPRYNAGATLTVGVDNGSGEFSGTIKDCDPGQGNSGDNGGSPWPLALVKTGTGTQTLSGFNTYSGGTTVNNGTLKVGTTSGIGPGNLTVNGGATAAGIFDLNGNDAYVSALNGAAGAVSGKIVNNVAPTMDGEYRTLNVGGGNGSFAGVLANNTGTGGILAFTKAGEGTQILTGNNTYTGPTSVSGGTLLVNGSLAAGSAVSVSYGAKLGGTGTILGATTVNNSGIIEAGQTNGSVLTFGSLALGDSASANVLINLGPASNYAINPAINVTGANGLAAYSDGSSSAQTKINIAGALLTAGTYKLIGYQGTIGGTGFNAFHLGMLPAIGRGTASLVNNTAAHEIDLSVTNGSIKWNGVTSGEWTGGPKNWKFNGADTSFQANDIVIFDDAAVGTTAVNINGAVGPATVVFNGSKNYSINATDSASYIQDSSLTNPDTGEVLATTLIVAMTGSGSVTLNSANNYTGGTVLSSGTLNIGNVAALGYGPVTISGGTIDNTTGAAAAMYNNTFIWNGNFTFAGNADGTHDLSFGTSDVTLGANTQITVNAGNLTNGGVISGEYGLTKAGPGTLTLNDVSKYTYTGPTVVNAGRLVLTDLAESYSNTFSTSAITIASGAVLEANNIGFDDWIANYTLSGSGTFQKTGASSMSFAGYAGMNVNLGSGALIDIQGGSLLCQWGANINWTNNLASLNVASGATFEVWDGDATTPLTVRVNSLTGSGTILGPRYGGSAILAVGMDGGSGTYSGFIQDTANPLGLTKNGTGTEKLSGMIIPTDTRFGARPTQVASNFSGNITVNGGTLIGAAVSVSPTSSVFGKPDNARTITVNSGATMVWGAANIFGGHFVTTVPTLVINGGTVTNADIADEFDHSADPAGTVYSHGTNNALNNVTLINGTLTSTTGCYSTVDTPSSPAIPGWSDRTYGAWDINGTVTSRGNSLITTTAAANGQIMLGSGSPTAVTTFDVQDGTLTVSTNLIDGDNGSDRSGLRKIGVGTMTITAQALYHGDTTVNAGTLNVGALVHSPNVTVAGTGTLNATSIVADTLTIGGTPTVVATAVPEPGTMILLLVAAGLGFALRFRKR